MGSTDELINDYGYSWFVAHFSRYSSEYFEKHTHLIKCGTAKVSHSDRYWNCGCYSSWTRDDNFVIDFHIRCECDVEVNWSPWVYAEDFDLPSILGDLYEYQNNTVCNILNREYY